MRAAISILVLSASLTCAAAARAEDRELVRVNGTPIRQSEVMDRLWQRYGPETLDGMINELVFRQAVQAAGIEVSRAEIDAEVEKVKNSFPDPKLFEAQLKQAGSSLEQLRSEVAEQLAREKFVIAREKLTASDAELRAAFAAHKDELGTPEGVHLRHMVLRTQAEADAVVAELKKGADFRAIAKEKSIAPTGKLNGGDYGMVSKGALPPEIEQVAFSMKPGEIRVLPGEKGVHILQTLERRKAVPPVYSKVKRQLRELVLRDKIRQVLPQLIKELRDKADIQTQGV